VSGVKQAGPVGLSFIEHDLRANAFGICREGKLEDFVSHRPPHGNKSAVVSALDGRRIAIFAMVSTPRRGEPIPFNERL
jgi:hypothetical protein